MVKMNQILRFYHFVYVHGAPSYYGLFYTFEEIHHGKSIYYMAHIYKILFVYRFLYDVFHLCEEQWNSSKPYHIDCIHNFSYSMNQTTFAKWTRTKRRIAKYPVLRYFLHWDLGYIPSNLRKPINCKLVSYSESLPKV